MGNKIIQTTEELQSHLNEQLEFLKTSAESYDDGFIGEAKRMATTIRVLLHDTSASLSLLGQLHLKNGKFFSTSVKEPQVGANQQKIGSYAGLIGIFVGKGVNGYVPYLDEIPSDITGYVDFDHYWNETIFVDNQGNNHSRKDIVLSVANQDGGSHVDPKLDEKYAKLSRQNSLGWMAGDDKGNWVPVKGAELAAIRQITHELLRTLVPTYPQQKKLSKGDGLIVGGAGIILEFSPSPKIGKVGRNDPCPCGSGKKYKKCHGK